MVYGQGGFLDEEIAKQNLKTQGYLGDEHGCFED